MTKASLNIVSFINIVTQTSSWVVSVSVITTSNLDMTPVCILAVKIPLSFNHFPAFCLSEARWHKIIQIRILKGGLFIMRRAEGGGDDSVLYFMTLPAHWFDR